MSHRNRLESNTEHWNALLLSLRELIEWVIRKDTELTGLGPVCGDIAALQKQQVRASTYTSLSLYKHVNKYVQQQQQQRQTRRDGGLYKRKCVNKYTRSAMIAYILNYSGVCG